MRSRPTRARFLALALAAPIAVASVPVAQIVGQPALPDVDWEQTLGAAVDLGLPFVDDEGRPVRLGDALGERPAVLALVYYECPMLCNLVLDGLVRAMRPLALDAGEDFDVVAISIDPRETPDLAHAKKLAYADAYGRDGAARTWRFLVGDEASIRSVTAAVGYRYEYTEATDEFAHPAGVTVLTADGRVSRILYGTDFAPRDLRFALIDAADGAIGSPIDKLILRCFHYDPTRGRYGFAILATIRGAGLLTVALIAGFVLRWTLAERRRRASPERSPA